MGKPDPIIYKFAEKVMGLSADQVLAVGDSLEHDICGGLFALFVSVTGFWGGIPLQYAYSCLPCRCTSSWHRLLVCSWWHPCCGAGSVAVTVEPRCRPTRQVVS